MPQFVFEEILNNRKKNLIELEDRATWWDAKIALAPIMGVPPEYIGLVFGMTPHVRYKRFSQCIAEGNEYPDPDMIVIPQLATVKAVVLEYPSHSHSISAPQMPPAQAPAAGAPISPATASHSHSASASSAPAASEECAICLEPFDSTYPFAELSCGHHFHRPCIDEWCRQVPRPTCPLCRQPIDAPPPASESRAVAGGGGGSAPAPPPRRSSFDGSSGAVDHAKKGLSLAEAAVALEATRRKIMKSSWYKDAHSYWSKFYKNHKYVSCCSCARIVLPATLGMQKMQKTTVVKAQAFTNCDLSIALCSCWPSCVNCVGRKEVDMAVAGAKSVGRMAASFAKSAWKTYKEESNKAKARRR